MKIAEARAVNQSFPSLRDSGSRTGAARQELSIYPKYARQLTLHKTADDCYTPRPNCPKGAETMKFTAASLVLCAAVISAWAASTARVLAGPIQFSTFAFADDGSPAFRYVGGDVPNVATAEITGYLVMAYDAEIDFAWLSVLHGKLHTPKQVVGGGLNGAAWLDDAAIEDRMPGLFRQLWGERIEDSEFFLFGPVVTGNQEFVAHFVLSTDPSSPRLSGKATTLRDDGPSYFLDAPLTAIPEPATLSLVCCGALAAAVARLRGSLTAADELPRFPEWFATGKRRRV